MWLWMGWAAAEADTLRGRVTDSSGAAAPAAVVAIVAGGYSRETWSAPDGKFAIRGVPPGTYALRVSLPGFKEYRGETVVSAGDAALAEIRLELAEQQTTVNVEASADAQPAPGILVEQPQLAALPALAANSRLNDAIVFTTPGVAADSNGFFHPLGDHAQVSYVIDGQPIADQRNKVFSVSIPSNAIESMEVISGSPGAEYGDKTSLIIDATTRSGLGRKPSGSILGYYGSFGTVGEEASFGAGNARWGNFLVFNAERTGRFLDSPEFWPMHDVGNSGTLFDRLDYRPGAKDALHLDIVLARNWTQVPNTYDQPLQDQKQKAVWFNLAPAYERTVDARTVVSVNAFARRDRVDYYPSRNSFDDSPATLAQDRSLTNLGGRASLARVAGRHNWKVGAQAGETRLREFFQLGLTDPGYDPSLLRYDLSRGGKLYEFRGSAAIRQLAGFAQDTVSFGGLTLSLGVRFDRYRGLTSGDAWQPRGAFSYRVKATGSVIRGGFSRTLETPANENLVVSSSTGPGGLANNLFEGTAEQKPIALGRRNQYDAGIQQSLGRWVKVDVSYFRKYTRNAFDFDALFSTPITFPIGWKQSKLDGVSARLSTADLRGLRVYATMGHANARFFGPEVGGVVFNSNLEVGAYRQDHDQVFQQNVNLHYQPKPGGWWTAFTWRYDSGLVVGAVNGRQDALALSADQQSMIGLYCGQERASLTHRIAACDSPAYGASRVRIPAPGTANADHNPPRATPRNIVDLGAGTENLFRREGIRTALRFTVLNLTNEAALYNFLSPFGGTHWVGPRAYQAQLGWTF